MPVVVAKFYVEYPNDGYRVELISCTSCNNRLEINSPQSLQRGEPPQRAALQANTQSLINQTGQGL